MPSNIIILLFADNPQLEKILRSMNRKLDLILGYMNHEEHLNTTGNNIDKLPTFPISTLEEYQKFCDEVKKDEILRKQFVSMKN